MAPREGKNKSPFPSVCRMSVWDFIRTKTFLTNSVTLCVFEMTSSVFWKGYGFVIIKSILVSILLKKLRKVDHLVF